MLTTSSFATVQAWRKLSGIPYALDLLGEILLRGLCLGASPWRQSVLCSVAASSVLSAKAVLSHNTMGLIMSSNCGPLFFNDSTGLLPYNDEKEKKIEEINTATEYVRSCYRSVPGSQCSSSYIVQSLPYNITTDAACPFDNELCANL